VGVGELFSAVSFRELPATTPLKPLQLPNPYDQATFDAQIPPVPIVNPQGDPTHSSFGLLGIGICNTSTTTSHLIEGAILQIANFTPFVGGVNELDVYCSEFYSRSVASGVTGGGCGGGTMTEENLLMTFPPQAGAGSLAIGVQDGQSGGGYGPFPVSLPPGREIGVGVLLATPQTPGIYTFTIAAKVDHGQLPFLSGGQPRLFAPVAHKFTGAACLTSVMQQQIPPQVSPPLYFACPS
jgi:hypothetical protein